MATTFIFQPNEEWHQTVNALLGDDADAHNQAHEQLWLQVEHFVLHRATLPIGRLRDDDEAKRDIVVGVMRKLQANQYAHIRDWRDRQAAGKNHASWWSFVKVIVRTTAIDYVRGSRLNLVPRKEGFVLARVQPTDPTVLQDVQSSTAAFLDQCSSEALFDYFERFQWAHWPSQEPPPPQHIAAAKAQTKPRRRKG